MSSDFLSTIKLKKNYQKVAQAVERHDLRSQILEEDLVKGK